MTKAAENLRRYVFSVDAVRKAINTLSNIRSHEHLPGYLALLGKRRPANEQQPGVADIETFYREHMRVTDAPDESPYLQPFRSRGAGTKLLNRNLQGSYAPSSIRAGKPLSHVIDIVEPAPDGGSSPAEYRLRPDHAIKALSHMLEGNRVPVTALAVFLWRDHALLLEEPTFDRVVEAFRKEFRLRPDDDEGELIFDTLFVDDTSEFDPDELQLLED